MPVGLTFRLKFENVKIVPKKWMLSFSLIFILCGLILLICESFLLAKGITRSWAIGTSNGVRIGISVVYILTSVSCLIMVLRPSKKKVANFAAFLLSLGSLIGSVILISNYEFFRNNSSVYGFRQIYESKDYQPFTEFWNFLEKSDSGKLLYPFWPWTPLKIIMDTIPFLVIPTSSSLLITCLNLWISVRIFPENLTNDEESKKKVSFSIIGGILSFCAFSATFSLLLIPLIANDGFWFLDGTTPFLSLTLSFGASLAFSVHSNYKKVERRFGLLLLSFVILSASILTLMNLDSSFNNSYIPGEYFLSTRDAAAS